MVRPKSNKLNLQLNLSLKLNGRSHNSKGKDEVSNCCLFSNSIYLKGRSHYFDIGNIFLIIFIYTSSMQLIFMSDFLKILQISYASKISDLLTQTLLSLKTLILPILSVMFTKKIGKPNYRVRQAKKNADWTILNVRTVAMAMQPNDEIAQNGQMNNRPVSLYNIQHKIMMHVSSKKKRKQNKTKNVKEKQQIKCTFHFKYHL